MIAEQYLVERPQRWDQPYGEMSDEEVSVLLARPEFAAIDAGRFPATLSLPDVLKHDCRIRRLAPGELMIREGDYGNSAFFILDGRVQVVIKPGLPSRILGRSEVKRRGLVSALSQLWRNSKIPEARDFKQGRLALSPTETETVNIRNMAGADKIFTGPVNPKTGLNGLAENYQTTVLESGGMVGEIAALGRVQRTATVFADEPTMVLEMRWQGLREIRKFDPVWRQRIDESYREHMLVSMLAASPYFSGLDNAVRNQIAQSVQFETYGSHEWTRDFKGRAEGKSSSDAIGSKSEPIVAEEGHYPNGALLLGAGFARVSKLLGNGRQTQTYLRAGDIFGLEEVHRGWLKGEEMRLNATLSAIGYIHVLRIPYHVLEEHVFPAMKENKQVKQHVNSLAGGALLEWAVDERWINGTKVMLIDQDRCVRCDDCVSACAATHDGNPRFIRHGKSKENWLVTNACMHCTDPVCMIGCPTGAIHRTVQGSVVINDTSCIGCATCANSCPYDNIRMVEIYDKSGRAIVDSASGQPVVKATKCDLCSTQPGGPACVRACPHDALKRVDFHDDVLSGLT